MTQVILYTSRDGNSVVKESFTTAADGDLAAIPAGSLIPAQRRPCHG
jgi:hypothetical protein